MSKRNQAENPNISPAEARAVRAAKSMATPPRPLEESFFPKYDYAELQLLAAISHVEAETREAPWYGPWDLVLRSHLDSTKGTKTSGVSLTSFPQYPLFKHLDTNVDLPVKDDFSSDEDETGLDDVLPSHHSSTLIQGLGDDLDYTTSRAMNSAENSPDRNVSSFISPIARPWSETYERPQPHTPERAYNKSLSDPRFLKAVSSEGKTITVPPAGKRSTRIPDFVQKRLHWTTQMKIISAQITLLIECKAALTEKQLVVGGKLSILPQVQEQALHAFASDHSLQVVGVIMTFGGYWTYTEYFRENFTAPLAGTDDSTYSPPSTGSSGSEFSTRSTPDPLSQSIGGDSRVPARFNTPLRKDIMNRINDSFWDMSNSASRDLFTFIRRRLDELETISTSH